MSDVIKTAGLQAALANQPAPNPSSPRRQAISLIRAAIRKADASDEEVDDALEALVELAKD